MSMVPSSANGFWKRDFLLALTGYFLLFLSVALFALFPLQLQSFGASQARIGAIMGIHSLLAISVRPFIGRRIDEQGGRRLSIAGLVFFMAVLPFFFFVRGAGLLPLALRALTGIAWGTSMTATMAICSDLAPVDRLARSIGVIGVGGLVASALGPVLAEELVEAFGFKALFGASWFFLAASLGCMLLTRRLPPPERWTDSDPGRKPFAGLAAGSIAIIAVMTVGHGAVRGSIVNFIALFGREAGFARVGPFFFALSAAAIATRMWGGGLSDRYGRKAVIIPAAVLIGLNLFWIAGTRSFPVFLLNGLIAGLGQGLIFPSLSTYIIDVVGLRHKAFALSLYLALFDAGVGLGSPFFGWVADLSGTRTMYVAAGALLFLATAIFAWKGPDPVRAP